MSYNFELMDEHRALVDQEVHPIKLNLAAVYLRQERFNEAILCCDYVLKQNPANSKALYRRAKAKMDRGWLDEARLDLEKCSLITPDDKQVKLLLRELKKLGKQDESRERDLWNRSLGSEGKQPSQQIAGPPKSTQAAGLTTWLCHIL
eukprot:TRINITY_DN25680_c0_g1_i3.p1 TRINITY_DN25680_c0_g1~~TRINITY_DN25680_c0_g1_i3.p1  ORF type:complete len:148 (+),score=44.30 TRINITY_DN25680_c0_g1_i3:345-788(+)